MVNARASSQTVAPLVLSAQEPAYLKSSLGGAVRAVLGRG
jgi:hypothetical protein